MLLELFEMVARGEITSLQASQELEALIKTEWQEEVAMDCGCMWSYAVSDYIEWIQSKFDLM